MKILGSNNSKDQSNSTLIRIIRILAILIGGLVWGYLALYLVAWSTRNPENPFAQIIVYGAIFLPIAFALAIHFKAWRIISNAFRDD